MEYWMQRLWWAVVLGAVFVSIPIWVLVFLEVR
jgi:hypothetical protein